jgi:uncharacterized membrane protein YcaP (DUF421 family)
MIGAVWRPLVIYAVLLVIFRTTGKRSLSKATTFDFVLVLIISEAVSSALLADDNSVSGALIAVITLIVFDVVLSLARRRWRRVDQLISYEPTLLMHDGQLLEQNCRREGVDTRDILEAARLSHGIVRLRDIQAVVLESSGALSIVPAVPQSAEIRGDTRDTAH